MGLSDQVGRRLAADDTANINERLQRDYSNDYLIVPGMSASQDVPGQNENCCLNRSYPSGHKYSSKGK